MQKGDIDFCMYQMAARHFRPPLHLLFDRGEVDTYSLPQEADTYIVRDDLEQLLALIKVYDAEDEEEEKLIHTFVEGIAFLSSLDLKSSVPTKPIDFELAEIEAPGKEYVALFTVPEGRTLQAHIRYLLAQKEVSLERQQAFEILKNGYQQTAIALAELHTKRYSPVCQISEYYWKSHMDACQAVVKSLHQYADKLPFNLVDYSEKLLKLAASAYQKPCSAAFLHGNPVASSLNFEAFSGVLSLLDLENAYHSISDSKTPCGPSGYDYVWAAASFELQMTALDGPQDEIQDILYEYQRVYKDLMSDRFPSPHHLCFYEVLFWLPVYRKLFVSNRGDEEKMNPKTLRLFQKAFSKIEAVLKFKDV